MPASLQQHEHRLKQSGGLKPFARSLHDMLVVLAFLAGLTCFLWDRIICRRLDYTIVPGEKQAWRLPCHSAKGLLLLGCSFCQKGMESMIPSMTEAADDGGATWQAFTQRVISVQQRSQ